MSAVSRVWFHGDRIGWLTYRDGDVFQSVDGGRHWARQVEAGRLWNPFGFGFPGRIAYADARNGVLLGGPTGGKRSGSKLFSTLDGGKTWEEVAESADSFLDVWCQTGRCWVLGAERLFRLL